MRRFDPIRNRVINRVNTGSSLESAMQILHEAESNLVSLNQSVAELKALCVADDSQNPAQVRSGELGSDMVSSMTIAKGISKQTAQEMVIDTDTCIDALLSKDIIEEIYLSLLETTSEISFQNKMSTKAKEISQTSR